ncbi:calcium-binding protein [Hansschlegelia plantiphila]|uniref:Calcium-binding protein n=1 Tax=Hansschlegelia plantiphila TaxID=374655 RepID=A0A9W6J0L7_9HYPH|nr:calcium-binding protein [Hansschlegelia plantiphila]GLK67566.1 hypothetical protein GCM10008179_12040 [Hansschlegelia plantiphila]
MPVVSDDIVVSNVDYAYHFTGSPETAIIKDGVLVYLYNASDQYGTIVSKGFNFSSLINYGHVVGDGGAVAVWMTGYGGSVRNAASGDISAEIGVIFDGYGNLDNEGDIVSSFFAVSFADGGYLDNSGLIRGAVVANLQSISLTIQNSGVVEGDFRFTTDAPSGHSSRLNITNSGTIDGDISFRSTDSGGSSSIANSGEIHGDVSLGVLVDAFDNRGGEITGDVALRDGSDTFDNRGGHVFGVVDGGSGDDTFIIDADPLTIVENAGVAGGVDTLKSSTMSLNLENYRNIENLALMGTAKLNLTGDDGANALTGNGGVNVLRGLGGSDLYFVQNAKDVVIEANHEGTDTVRSTVSFSLAGQFIEHLYLDGAGDLSGTGNTLANTITGNSGKNLLIGGAGADTLYGGGDIDTASYAGASKGVSANLATSAGGAGDAAGDVFVSIENLTGSSYADKLTGNIDANVIQGGAGADTMTGGAGADVYYVDNVGDVVAESKSDNAADLVHSTVSFSLAGQYTESLSLEGSKAINGAGNSLQNGITGNSAANVIDGGRGNDYLLGRGGADTFVFHSGFGKDLVDDFVAGSASGHDLIQFDKSLFANFSAVMNAATETNNVDYIQTDIRFSDADIVTLYNVSKASLVAADFLFV